MTEIEKQINKITKRINNNRNTQDKPLPQELIQCVVFYSTPIDEYLEINSNIFTSKKIKNKNFVFPYYSKEIFVDQKSAEIFLPHFIQRLIKEEKIPDNIDELIKKNRIQTAVAPLVVTFVEENSEPEITKEQFPDL